MNIRLPIDLRNNVFQPDAMEEESDFGSNDELIFEPPAPSRLNRLAKRAAVVLGHRGTSVAAGVIGAVGTVAHSHGRPEILLPMWIVSGVLGSVSSLSAFATARHGARSGVMLKSFYYFLCGYLPPAMYAFHVTHRPQ